MFAAVPVVDMHRKVSFAFLLSVIIVAGTCTLTTVAFSLVPHHRTLRFSNAKFQLSSSAPSDNTYDDYEDDNNKNAVVVDTESSDYTPNQGEALVSDMMDLLPSFSESNKLSPEQRTAIHEAIYKLEALNPNKDSPASSPLLNGVYELKYAGGYDETWALPSPTRQIALFLYSGGYSPGVFAYTMASNLPGVQLGAVEIAISRSQPRVTASVPVKLFSGMTEGSVAVVAKLEVESAIRLRETYEQIQLINTGSNGQTINRDIPEFLRYSRDLYVTYLDEDFLIVRDGSGVPEVLVRKEKQFSKSWGTEPGAVSDLMPPGDGKDAEF
jgi:hypothetical protein